MKYAVEIHEIDTHSFIECIDKFDTLKEAERCKNELEFSGEIDEEKEYVDIYCLECE